MSWFSFKKRGHIIRNEHGIMVAKVSARVLTIIMERYGDDFTLSTDGTKYIYRYEGFSIGQSEMVKVFLWKGYTIECAAKEI